MVQISAADSYGKGATVSGKRVKESHVPGLGLAICRIVTCNVQVNIVSVHQIVTVTVAPPKSKRHLPCTRTMLWSLH